MWVAAEPRSAFWSAAAPSAAFRLETTIATNMPYVISPMRGSNQKRRKDRHSPKASPVDGNRAMLRVLECGSPFCRFWMETLLGPHLDFKIGRASCRERV